MLKCDNVVTVLHRETKRERKKKQRKETEGEKRDIISAGKSNVLVTVVISDTQQNIFRGNVGKMFPVL